MSTTMNCFYKYIIIYNTRHSGYYTSNIFNKLSSKRRSTRTLLNYTNSYEYLNICVCVYYNIIISFPVFRVHSIYIDSSSFLVYGIYLRWHPNGKCMRFFSSKYRVKKVDRMFIVFLVYWLSNCTAFSEQYVYNRIRIVIAYMHTVHSLSKLQYN